MARGKENRDTEGKGVEDCIRKILKQPVQPEARAPGTMEARNQNLRGVSRRSRGRSRELEGKAGRTASMVKMSPRAASESCSSTAQLSALPLAHSQLWHQDTSNEGTLRSAQSGEHIQDSQSTPIRTQSYEHTPRPRFTRK